MDSDWRKVESRLCPVIFLSFGMLSWGVIEWTNEPMKQQHRRDTKSIIIKKGSGGIVTRKLAVGCWCELKERFCKFASAIGPWTDQISHRSFPYQVSFLEGREYDSKDKRPKAPEMLNEKAAISIYETNILKRSHFHERFLMPIKWENVEASVSNKCPTFTIRYFRHSHY